MKVGVGVGGGGWCFDYYLPWNSQPPPAGRSKSKEGFCKSKEGWDPSFHLHYLFTSSPDYTPPLIIIKHPSFHLQLLIGHLYWVFSSSNAIKAFIQPDDQLQSCLLTVLFMDFITNHHKPKSFCRLFSPPVLLKLGSWLDPQSHPFLLLLSSFLLYCLLIDLASLQTPHPPHKTIRQKLMEHGQHKDVILFILQEIFPGSCCASEEV